MSPISKLSKGLKLHYENNGKDFFYASSNQFAYVLLVFAKEESSKKLKRTLLNLVKIYNQTDIKNKDSISFNIVFDYLEKSHPLPPMPTEF